MPCFDAKLQVNKRTRGECLPCERLVQGKRHVGKKALLTQRFLALLRSQKLLESLESRDEIYPKYMEY